MSAFRPSNRKIGRSFKEPYFKAPVFKPPSFKELPRGEVHIKADQVREMGRQPSSVEADLVNAHVTAHKDPEVWEEWEVTIGGSETSRTSRMRRYVTTALRKLLGLGSSD